VSTQAAATGWNIRDDPGLPEAARPLWTRREGDAWAFAFEARAAHANGSGAIHGGMLATFMDHALGLTVREAVDRMPVATIQLDLQYLAAARPGMLVEARGEVLRRTRSVVFVRGALTAEGAVILAASGIWKVLASGGSRAATPP
jgi:acyl-coenzyme A thioesterase PaaI-like protein